MYHSSIYDDYTIIPVDDFFYCYKLLHDDFKLYATNSDLLILRNWLNYRFDKQINCKDTGINTISFNSLYSDTITENNVDYRIQ